MNQSDKLYKISLMLAGAMAVVSLIMIVAGAGSLTGIPLVAMFAFLAIGIRQYPTLKGMSFTVWVFSAVTLAMFYPQYIVDVGGYKTVGLIVPLIQIIMFGMGTSMSVEDFTNVLKMPKGVLIGSGLQFTVMPLIGIGLATVFGFPAEIAAGVVLIGSSPGGVASNVIAFLARGNVALSVTLTTVSTLISPIMTPFMMKTLAGQFIEINFVEMMISIFNMIIIPVVAGLIFNAIFKGRAQWLHDWMPTLSMLGIVVIIGVITASGRNNLLVIGPLLILAAILHNGLGYLLGYWGARLFGMSERDSRTVAIEVGMQNGGMASGIAVQLGREATMGLAPAVFGPWMNISGSVLANWWKDKPTGEDDDDFDGVEAGPEEILVRPDSVNQ